MDIFTQILKDLKDRIENIERGSFLKKISIPADGYFVVKAVSSDPISPQNNEIWINTTTNTLKWNKSGTIKSVTLT